MTDLTVPNRSHIFSPALVLRQLDYRLGLRMMVFADDVVLRGRTPSASPESAPTDGTFQAAGLVLVLTGAPSPHLVLRSTPSPALARPCAPRLTSPRSAIFRLTASRLGPRTISAVILTPSWRAPRRLTEAILPAEFDNHMRATASPGLVHLSCTTLGRPLPVTPRPWCSLRRHRLHPSL
jgi:hypothetical protein